MEYGCIGEHLKHSFSAEIHRELASYQYEIREIEPTHLGEFLTERDFKGINVTIPYKEKVIPYLFSIDEQAKAIGAVNTVVNRDGKLYGYNTDFYGMSALINKLGLDLTQKKVAVLGTGGTSRTALAVAESMGARSVFRVSRTARDGAIDYEMLYREHADTEIIINTTPCGMYPNPDGVAVDVSRFSRLAGVVDAVYNPLRPQLVLDALKRGIPAEGGLFMLVAQAVHACEIFLDKQFDADTSERIWKRLLRQKENIVLIGMPSCGKSTVGRLLGEAMGREVCDMDAMIVQTSGQTIPEIFASVGESGFREIESRVLKEQLAQRNGLIISTGGGVILRDENVNELRHNGRLYFIDRPLCDLLPTEDRPLGSSREAIRARFEERYDRYCAVADKRIAVEGDAESVAEAIGKDFENI